MTFTPAFHGQLDEMQEVVEATATERRFDSDRAQETLAAIAGSLADLHTLIASVASERED
jgi:hypothetical protein